MGNVTVKGGAVTLGGSFPNVGEQAKDFSLANDKREDVNLATYGNQRKILNIFPSVDTPTCALSVKRFNDEASKLDNTVVLCI